MWPQWQVRQTGKYPSTFNTRSEAENYAARLVARSKKKCSLWKLSPGSVVKESTFEWGPARSSIVEVRS